jgi:hypothetical protein
MFFVRTLLDPVAEEAQAGDVPKWTTSLVRAAVCVAHETSILPAAYSKMWICGGARYRLSGAFCRPKILTDLLDPLRSYERERIQD